MMGFMVRARELFDSFSDSSGTYGSKKANGTTKAINLTTNISALVIFLLNAKVMLPLGIIAGAFNIAGNYIGTKFFDRGGAKSVKLLTIVVIVIFFIKVLLEILG